MQSSTVMRMASSAPCAAASRHSAGLRPFAPLRTMKIQQQHTAIAKRHSGAAQWRQRADPESAPEPAAAAPAPAAEDEETVFYEGSGSSAELVISLLLGATLLYLPLTMASIGRRLWVSYKFTNKRLIVKTSSPVIKREIQIEYSKIKEVRSAPRAFGLWGDVVFFLKDGSRLPIAGLERYQELVDYVQGKLL